MSRLSLFTTLLSLVLLLSCGPATLSAQVTSGTIDYTEVRVFPMWDGMSKEQKERMEKLRAEGAFDQTGRLSFTPEHMSYSQLPKEVKPNAGRGSWWMRQNDNPDIYFTNLADSTITDRRRIMDRSFLLQDEWITPEWDVPENQQLNMAYMLPSKAAFATTADGDTLTAYFTPSIPVGIGPRGFGGLPGAIVYLKVERGEAYTEYKMTTMQPNAPDLNIVAPTDGDVLDRKEFDKIKKKREEAMERRRRSWERSRG